MSFTHWRYFCIIVAVHFLLDMMPSEGKLKGYDPILPHLMFFVARPNKPPEQGPFITHKHSRVFRDQWLWLAGAVYHLQVLLHANDSMMWVMRASSANGTLQLIPII